MCSKVRTPHILQVYCTYFTCRAALYVSSPFVVPLLHCRLCSASLAGKIQRSKHTSLPFDSSLFRFHLCAFQKYLASQNTCRSDLNNASLVTQDSNSIGFISRGGPCHSHLQILKKALQFTFSQTQKLISIVAVTAIVKKSKIVCQCSNQTNVLTFQKYPKRLALQNKFDRF